MNALRILVISASAVLVSAASAQTDSTLEFSLIEAQNYAVDHYFLSKNAELDIESAQKRIWETTAMGLPQVSTNGDYQRYLDDVPPAFNMPAFDQDGNIIGSSEVEIFQKENWSLGANVSQLIFSGEYIVGLQASKVYKLLSEENYEKTVIDLKENLAGTYFAILILRENERVLQRTLDNLQLNLEHSQKTYEVGLIEETDVSQIDLTVKRTENDLQTIKNQLETMQRMLKYQLGVENTVEVILTDKLPDLVQNNIVDQSNYQFNLDENIDYRMLLTQENLQELTLKREKSLLLPTLSGFYNYNAVLNSTAFTPPQHLVGVSASWTLFQSGMRTARISQARIELEKAQNMKDQEAQRLILTAQQAQYDYETALTKYYNEQENFDLSEKIFNQATKRYQEGLISSLDLSIINTQYLQAQLSYAMSIQDLLTSKVALDKAFSNL